MKTDGITWIKAAKSADSGNCVELGVGEGSAVYLRDSKDKEGPVLVTSPSGMAAFIRGAKMNEFDFLIG
jgi:hypothetical protein